MTIRHKTSFVHSDDLNEVLTVRKNKIYATFYNHVMHPSDNIMVSCPLGYEARKSDISQILGVGILDKRVLSAGIKPCVAVLSHCLAASASVEASPTSHMLNARNKGIVRSATSILRLDTSLEYQKEMSQTGSSAISMRS